jgi:RNA polymerase sigma-70 factor (ECF subfamily)
MRMKFDEDVFNKEAMVHRAPLYHHALRLTRNETEAEDLVQETYLRAFRFWSRYEPGTNCKAWLFKILKNVYINHYRKDQKVPQSVDFASLEDNHYETLIEDTFIRRRGEPEVEFLEMDLKQEIAKALSSLPQEYQEAILLCLVEGYAYQEAADILGVAIGTIMSRVYRGRRLLMTRLLEYATLMGYLTTAQGDSAKADLEDFQRRRRAQPEEKPS